MYASLLLLAVPSIIYYIVHIVKLFFCPEALFDLHAVGAYVTLGVSIQEHLSIILFKCA